MSNLDYKYTYELHFPMHKEVFYSDQSPNDFMEQFASETGVINTSGDRVIMVRAGGGMGNMICFLKQRDNNMKF